MSNLTTKLKGILQGCERLAILAVGSRLRGDDAVGLLVGEELESLAAGTSSPRTELAVFYGETAPENITGEVKKFRPTHVVLVDAADMGLEPGAAQIVDLDPAAGGASFSTHRMPVTVLLDYLHGATGCKCAIVGIQAASSGFCLTPSIIAVNAAKQVAASIAGACGRA